MRWRLFPVLFLLILSACTNASASLSPVASPPPATTEPTSAPTRPLTVVSVPTRAPTATDEPIPTATQAPTSLPEPTLAPTSVPTAVPTAVPTSAPTGTPVPAATQVPTGATSSVILFLRGGDVYALDMGSGKTRLLIEDVADFVPSADGQRIVFVRGQGAGSELWLAHRDGSGETQLTSNDRAEATPDWSPDGGAIVYSSSTASTGYGYDWFIWSNWCMASEIRVLDLAAHKETTLAKGCDPALSPDGRRIAYAAPPASIAEGYDAAGPGEKNAIRLINRQGQNGWNFAKADGTMSPSGMVVYAPSWTPDGASVLYQRFVGTQVEVSINLTELGRSFEGKGRAIGEGAGWLLAAQPAPGGKYVAITSHNYDDARGLSGYGVWGVSLIKLEGEREVVLPSGSETMIGQEIDGLQAAQRTAWSPDGATLAVQLPESWKPGADIESFGEGQGSIWRWQPGATPSEQLVDDVDFASPIYWLPAS